MIDSRPVAILNKQGIWINRYGLISWQHVEDVSLFSSKHLNNVETLQAHMQREFINPAIGIKIKKNAFSLIKKQSSFWGKLELTITSFVDDYCVKFFDYSGYISLGGVSTPVEEILSFADRYLEK